MSENEIREVVLLGIKTNKDFQKYACNFKLLQKASQIVQIKIENIWYEHYGNDLEFEDDKPHSTLLRRIENKSINFKDKSISSQDDLEMYLTNSTKEGRYLSQFDKIYSAKSSNNESKVTHNKLTELINKIDEKMKRLENDNKQEVSKQKKETFESFSNKMEDQEEEQTQFDIFMAQMRLLEEKLNISKNYKEDQLNFIISFIRFKDFKIEDDPLEWLNNSLHKLKFYRLPQNDKLRVLRSLLPSPLSEWSHKIDTINYVIKLRYFQLFLKDYTQICDYSSTFLCSNSKRKKIFIYE